MKAKQCNHIIYCDNYSFSCNLGLIETEKTLFACLKRKIENWIYNYTITSEEEIKSYGLEYNFDFSELECFDFFATGTFFNYCPICGSKNEIDFKTLKRELYLYYKKVSSNAKTNKKTKNNTEKTNVYGYIYVARMKEVFKIGVSKNPSKRFAEYTKLPYNVDLIILEKVLNPYELEKELHELLKEKRLRGEWFELSGNDIELTKKKIEDYQNDYFNRKGE